jgi:hypothetical protein
MSKVNKSEQIRKLYDEGKTVKEIKAKLKCSHALIAVVLRNYKNKTKKSKIVKAVTEMKQVLDVIEMRRPKHRLQATEIDPVNHPPHYKAGGFETIDFIEAKDLNYRLGNVVKYVSRAGKKSSDPVQDLEKAAWYLQREITARKNA